ncbi:MAG: hypothetical protein QUU85_14800, partial [Candidatus Eisenbacteria bacterium]|nr:hypothetical protein [Candidatus Eisenbacteria bacterium]
LDPAAVGEDLATSGSAFRLGGIFPNPVRDRTEIVVEALRSGVTSLGLYAPDGRRVATIQEGAVEPGSRRILWRAVDGAGRPLPSGVYFLRLVAPGVDSARLLIVSR